MSFLNTPSSIRFNEVPRRTLGVSIAVSILLILFGSLAIALPIAMSYSVVFVSSWLLMIAGVIQFVHLFRCPGIGIGFWKALVAAAYLIAGAYLRLDITRGAAILTLILAAFFLSESLVSLVAYFAARTGGASVWLLVEAILTFILGLMIWRHWPSNSLWMIGLLVGINMVITGSTRLLLTLERRKYGAGPRHGRLASAHGV